ncbi:hypothetical protein F0562_032543 [Nyssa sinensis]|uniref:Uncharacterized protein n=1 Tax=Nyssa sinensis TaxID=561372 RepID=A0A5J5AUG7_9ASTE|nr:hypothetical protein F0562_032543 [Nyssa sinensis]
MDILPSSAYFENIKRYWRRRKYRRLEDDNKKKLKMTRLGNKKRRVWKIRLAPKLRFRVVSPIKVLAKFHDAYIDMMIGLAGNNVGLFGGKRVPKGRPPMISSSDEVVDGRMVMRLVSTRELAALDVLWSYNG